MGSLDLYVNSTYCIYMYIWLHVFYLVFWWKTASAKPSSLLNVKYM